MIYIHEDEWEQFGNIYTKEKELNVCKSNI